MNSRLLLFFITTMALLVQGTYGQTFTNYTTTDGLLSNNVMCVAIDTSGSLWFGTQAGVSVFDGISSWSSHSTSSDTGLVDNNIEAIAATADGKVWVGTAFGASKYDGTSWVSFTTADGLGSNQVKYIKEDALGNIWLGTNIGLTKYDGSVFTNYGTADGLPFGGIKSITEHSSGDLWLGTGLGGIAIFDGSDFTLIDEGDGLLNDKVRAIAFDASDNKWVGTANGISVFNAANAHVTNHTRLYELPPPDTLNPVEDVQIDSKGNIWASIYVDYLVTEGAVSMYTGSAWISYDVDDGLVGPVVRRMIIDADDNVWVTTSTGITKISDVNSGIFDLKNAPGFSVFPNPLNDQLNITLSLELQQEGVALEIYSSNMQLVQTVNPAPGQDRIQAFVGQWSPGIYFARIGGHMEKFVKF